MKKFVMLIALAIAAVSGVAEILTPTQYAALNRRRAVSREKVQIDGTDFWVVRYMRGSKDDGATTNAVVRLECAEQKNPLQAELQAKVFKLVATQNELTETQTLIERLRTRCVNKRDYYNGLAEKAVLKTSKELWKAIADANQEIIDFIDGKVEGDD